MGGKVARLNNKVAIVTGGGVGMGRTVAMLFAREGAKVVVADWVAETAEETVKDIKKAGGEAAFVKTDVSKAEDIKKMIKVAVDTYGKLDVLYNNAAICIGGPLIEGNEADFDKMIGINLKGVWLGMKYAIPEMIKTGGGSIINVSSRCADTAERGVGLYAGTKGGVISISKAAAVEHAKQNIRVNVIKPGPTRTPMAETLLKGVPEVLKHILQETPDGRLAETEEIANLALFFASDESTHITGQKLSVDGGLDADGHTWI
jgi:NAD(P)-dependent dehydrogenase (short-subunit alcohol dehydrogenase family)